MSVTRNQVVKVQSPDGAISTGFLLGRADILVTTLHSVTRPFEEEGGCFLTFGVNPSESEVFEYSINVISADEGDVHSLRVHVAMLVPGTDVVVALLQQRIPLQTQVLMPAVAEEFDNNSDLFTMGFSLNDESGYPLGLEFSAWRNTVSVGERDVRSVMKLCASAHGEVHMQGFSGAPVVDSRGDVVAIITSYPNNKNEIYAVSVEHVQLTARAIVEALSSTDDSPSLSVDGRAAVGKRRRDATRPFLAVGAISMVAVFVYLFVWPTAEEPQVSHEATTVPAPEDRVCKIEITNLGDDRVEKVRVINFGDGQTPVVDIVADSMLRFDCPVSEVLVDLVVTSHLGKVSVTENVKIDPERESYPLELVWGVPGTPDYYRGKWNRAERATVEEALSWLPPPDEEERGASSQAVKNLGESGASPVDASTEPPLPGEASPTSESSPVNELPDSIESPSLTKYGQPEVTMEFKGVFADGGRRKWDIAVVFFNPENMNAIKNCYAQQKILHQGRHLEYQLMVERTGTVFNLTSLDERDIDGDVMLCLGSVIKKFKFRRSPGQTSMQVRLEFAEG